MIFMHAWLIISFWIVTAEMKIVYLNGMPLSDYITVLKNKNKFEKNS